jgi:hypothetical protein
MTGTEQIKKLEADVLEIKMHIKLAIEKLERISENHNISTGTEENIILLITDQLEDSIIYQVDGIVENFKYYLEGKGEVSIDDYGKVKDVIEEDDD